MKIYRSILIHECGEPLVTAPEWWHYSQGDTM